MHRVKHFCYFIHGGFRKSCNYVQRCIKITASVEATDDILPDQHLMIGKSIHPQLIQQIFGKGVDIRLGNFYGISDSLI
ncbi:hypothetical protein BMS3Bbin04_00893 [bacterium BMS3Bbin04]|nr:hypothetical protein BMS3Bbin04_00893 [bacterium BMS3Bbin04]